MIDRKLKPAIELEGCVSETSMFLLHLPIATFQMMSWAQYGSICMGNILASFLCSGRKQRRFIHLYLQLIDLTFAPAAEK